MYVGEIRPWCRCYFKYPRLPGCHLPMLVKFKQVIVTGISSLIVVVLIDNERCKANIVESSQYLKYIIFIIANERTKTMLFGSLCL